MNNINDYIGRKNADNPVCDYSRFRVVGNKLVSFDFMLALSTRLNGKIRLEKSIYDVPSLLGDYYWDLSAEERSIVGECIVSLIDTNSLILYGE
jgi:hypothetical protein